MKYFAYGSNMSQSQMNKRCANPVLLGSAVLHGYKFFINNRGVANIKENSTSKTYGVLYEITERDLKLLDKYEGYPDIYQRQTFKIHYLNTLVYATAYIDNNNLSLGEPRRNYLEGIYNAAKELNFSQDYIEELMEYESAKN
jgi:gamma-glutamylcyclotransferase (GGCT)/AIG2-like uncharacterized protein YtfP